MSAFGGFHRDVALPAEARLGDWRARATLAGTTITERFSVEEYRARTFEVKVKTPRRHGFLGKPLAFEVEANFLYGSPLAGGKLDWNVRRRRYLPRFEGWDEYTFQDFAKLADQGLWWARDEERSFSDGVADGQVTLDPAGRARIETKDVAPGDGPQDYLFEATVTDSSGQAVTSGTALTAHAADLVPGPAPGGDGAGGGDAVCGAGGGLRSPGPAAGGVRGADLDPAAVRLRPGQEPQRGRRRLGLPAQGRPEAGSAPDGERPRQRHGGGGAGGAGRAG